MIPHGERRSALVITEGMDMKKHSSFSTGGIAEYYAEPTNVYDCMSILEMAYTKNLDVHVIGAGTHILVSDEGVPGLVISTARLKGMTISGELLIAGAGETLDNVINRAIDHNLIGLEEIAGIPGSIAGAAAVNANANGRSIADVFFYSDYLNKNGEIHRRPYFHDESEAGETPLLLIAIALRLTPSRYSAEARVRKENYVEKMYIPPSRSFSGMIFHDTEEMKASDALRIAGLTGKNGTHAEFSEYQPNSILAYPGCTSEEIYQLIEHGRKSVREKLGINLSLSLTLLGNFRDNI